MSLTYSLLRPEEIAKFNIQQPVQQPAAPAIPIANMDQELQTPRKALPVPIFPQEEQPSAIISTENNTEGKQKHDMKLHQSIYQMPLYHSIHKTPMTRMTT